VKIARFDGGRIGVVVGDQIIDVTAACGVEPGEWPPMGMVRVIADFEALKPKIEAAVNAGGGKALSGVHLETPVPWPNKLLALPNNYAAHSAEMRGREYAVGGGAASGEAGFFMKANSSIVGPMDTILLPKDRLDRLFHHECELAVIVGKRARNVKAADADPYIFGYACLLDMTMRGKEERVMRKSYETFTPVGPWITTRDEVGATADLQLNLWVNGELRQSAPVNEMIVGIHQAIEVCSTCTTLEPGDIIASGTMAGVGPVVDGDSVTITIDKVGSMTLPVKNAT
jgi:2-keto-4-pentenoate hydratase/2-oxohepta-3-ene-1,7-dioic acid hydratase in catechol pathway